MVDERKIAERDWDRVGESPAHNKRADKNITAEIEKSLDLQMISIRLQRALIEDLKFIATAHGIGYQPLIRDILSRFVVHEKKKIIAEAQDRIRQELEDERQRLAKMELEAQRQKVA